MYTCPKHIELSIFCFNQHKMCFRGFIFVISHKAFAHFSSWNVEFYMQEPWNVWMSCTLCCDPTFLVPIVWIIMMCVLNIHTWDDLCVPLMLTHDQCWGFPSSSQMKLRGMSNHAVGRNQLNPDMKSCGPLLLPFWFSWFELWKYVLFKTHNSHFQL